MSRWLPSLPRNVAVAAHAPATTRSSRRPPRVVDRRWVGHCGRATSRSSATQLSKPLRTLEHGVDSGSRSSPSESINDYASDDSSGVARALRDMLATNLARSPELTVVSGSRLLEVERQMNGGAPSVAGAIVPVARQAGATTLVDGALYLLGVRYAAAGSARHQPAGWERAARVHRDRARSVRPRGQRHGASRRLPRLLGAARIRRRCDDTLGDGVSTLRGRAPLVSISEISRASATTVRRRADRGLDVRDGRVLLRTRDAHEPRASTSAACAVRSALAGRASDRERLIIEGGWAEANNSLSLRAIGETLAVRYPTEVEGHYYLGRALVNGGAFMDAIVPLAPRGADGLAEPPRWRRALRVVRRAAPAGGELRARGLAGGCGAGGAPMDRRDGQPTWVAYVELGRVLTAVGRVDEALSVFRTARFARRAWKPLGTAGDAVDPHRPVRARGRDAARGDREGRGRGRGALVSRDQSAPPGPVQRSVRRGEGLPTRHRGARARDSRRCRSRRRCSRRRCCASSGDTENRRRCSTRSRGSV